MPIVAFGFFLISKYNCKTATIWLAIASLLFYSFWSIKALPLLVISITTNYFCGKLLTPAQHNGLRNEIFKKRLLFGALMANFLLLGYFKYVNFFIDNINFIVEKSSLSKISNIDIVLPIGISFFTFTQIAFLVDCWSGKVKERNFFHYFLFVTYFPHLIAGPVLHHSQMMPQFAKEESYKINYSNIALGIIICLIGLSKKVLVADALSEYADLVFNSASEGNSPSFYMAWLGTLSYTFQIYFDFSAYSDMAIGFSLFFNIYLPHNFNSPYRAASIIDFWRRWHISLSNFLRDYVYIPLGGSRVGKHKRYINIFITMLLGGLWHGNTWTFILWGMLHSFLLIINHIWREAGCSQILESKIGEFISWSITFICICFTWVLFKAETLKTAAIMYKSLFNFNILVFNAHLWEGLKIFYESPGSWIFLLFGISFFLMLPPTHLINEKFNEIAIRYEIIKYKYVIFMTAFVAIFIFILSILKFGKHSPFLYFQF